MELMDEIQAGEYLGGKESPLSPRTLQRWRLEGRGPKYFKVGRLVRYSTETLNEYITANLHQSTSEEKAA